MLNSAKTVAYFDVVVVGGGLAGLTAAALAAKAGRSVALLERSRVLGGRADTQVRDGVHWNLGAHALFCQGHAFQLLRKLGVRFTGKPPNAGRLKLIGQDAEFSIANSASLLTTRFFSLPEKWRLIRLLARLGKLDSRAVDGICLSEWLDQTVGAGRLKAFLTAFFRANTYVNDPDHLSAGTALKQLQLYFRGDIWYLDDGWKTLVDGLRSLVIDGGGELRTDAPASSVQGMDSGVEVRTTDGTIFHGGAAILAVGPREACSLLDLPSDAPLVRWTNQSRPVRVASLDVALRRLPKPECRVAFGLDSPLYYSVHSASARLAPKDVVVLHAMKYRRPEEEESAETMQTQLEAWLDRLQPGWRDQMIQQRYLPSLLAAHAAPLAREEGASGRPSTTAAGRPNVFLSGDWVGDEGLLADASVASAEEAVRGALAKGKNSRLESLAHDGARSSV